MKIKYNVLFYFIISTFTSYSQNNKNQYNIRTIAFYNVENLFDTIHNQRFDTDRTPAGKDHYTSKIYWDKIEKIGRVISEIGVSKAKNSPTIVGLSEIENKVVIEDLISSSYLKNKGYGIIHYDSPDERGIDVGLIYLKRYFKPVSHSTHTLYLKRSNGKRDYTRDQLLVSGVLDGDLIHIIVNHWPSRSGGEARSRPFRMAAARLNMKIIDSLQAINPKAKIITMGDLNDDPISPSVRDILNAKEKKKNVKVSTGLFNPMAEMARKGLNTLAYRDGLNLFDQIIITQPFLEKDYSSYRFYQANIYDAAYLKNRDGRYKGYPFRSYSFSTYIGGYSDHFPVYIYLIKEKL